MRTRPPASSTTDALPHPAPHRSAPPTGRPTMSHILYRIGNFAGRHPWRVISAWLLLAVTVFTLNAWQGGNYDETFTPSGLGIPTGSGRDPGALPAGDRVHLQRHLPLRRRPHHP